ncbi:MAG TPA: YggS family pyridoxal phosphate-dependent enzyme [Mycobacteriales bacterium]|nr:YggS family pyridoxal phosphate-dependent enzyme [Mycobacteriales bacterium]
MTRRPELAARLAALRARIDAACAAAGRPGAEVTLVAVTKGFPSSDLRLLAELGVGDVGENRDREARAKWAELGGLGLRWHFVGRLQTNKCRSVAGYSDVVHSIDRESLVGFLAAGARACGRNVTGLVQVALDDTPGRGGISPDGVSALADAVAAADGLELGGVMAVAPLGADPAAAFARLAELAARVRVDHPAARMISAGMSSDLESAVAAGATHLRIGTALLGVRTPKVG